MSTAGYKTKNTGHQPQPPTPQPPNPTPNPRTHLSKLSLRHISDCDTGRGQNLDVILVALTILYALPRHADDEPEAVGLACERQAAGEGSGFAPSAVNLREGGCYNGGGDREGFWSRRARQMNHHKLSKRENCRNRQVGTMFSDVVGCQRTCDAFGIDDGNLNESNAATVADERGVCMRRNLEHESLWR